ncbi:cytochrome P450 family protein [Ceratobasidium sp. AG-Ba]|nr:cytochrome P450 family protein [Ceratobasidium sp. AG-Ba]
MPSERQNRSFHEMGKQFGSDVLSLTFFGMTFVVLNSATAAADLLEKRANIYSNRLNPVMLASPQLIDLRGSTGLMNPSDSWKRHRKIVHSRLNKHMVHVFRKQQQYQANALLQRMLSISHREQSLESLELELGRTIASTAFDMIYGYPLAVADDPFLLGQMTLTANLAKAVMPSNFLVNVLPFLAYVPAWLPGAGWKKTALEWRKQKDHTIGSIFSWTKTQIANGADDHSITATALMELQQLGYNQDDADEFAKNFSEALYEGATDTSTSSLLAFLLAMMLYPETQLKAQKEIDSVIGQDRLPTIEDRANLPYINALILEVLRWEPALPLAIPHVCTEDNEYRGYHIPKGAVVFGNIWSISHDEKTYNDPELFNPARFLDPDTPIPPSFGWGRRICPGNHFAQEMLFIIISSILAAFTISNTGGESVEENYLLVEGEGSSLTYRPKPFKCTIKPRSEKHSELISNVE